MAKYQLVIFDLDGTLLDTSEGVLESVKYTINKFGLSPLSEEKLLSFIGPPIPNSFANTYGLSGDKLSEAVAVFRNRYSQHDLLKAVPYEGIPDLFDSLSKNGITTAIATYKREDYALTLLKHYGFDRYTDIMFGADYNNKLKKSDIIEKCIAKSGVTDRKRIVMVGDTENDSIGAEKINVDFLAVTYGFGFKNASDLHNAKHVGAADTAMGLLNYILD